MSDSDLSPTPAGGAAAQANRSGAPRPVTIVCDSSIPITRAEAASLGCVVVSMHYLVDGVRHAERYEGENEKYDALFRNAKILSTEAVFQSAFHDEFRRVLERGSDVLCITMSSRLSGTYRSAVDARKQLLGEGVAVERIVVVDSWTTSGGLDFMVRRARRLVTGGATLGEAAAELERTRALQGIAFTVPRLDVLRRSGRLGAMRRAVAGKLDRYLIMVLDKGGIRDTDVAHGMGATVRTLVRQVPEGARKGLLVVSSYGDSAAADALVDCVHRMLPKATVEKRDGGPVVSLHLGVGSVSLAWDVPEGAK